MMYYKERFKDFFAIDELLCLQLIGYSDADICHSFYSPQEKEALQKTIANSPKQHEKAKQILKTVPTKQVKRVYGYIFMNNADSSYYKVYLDSLNLMKYNYGRLTDMAKDSSAVKISTAE